MEIIKFLSECQEHIIINLPNNRFGINSRYRFYSKRLLYTGGYFCSMPGLKIYSPEFVSIGERCLFSDNVILCPGGPVGTITIGNDVTVGFRAAIIAGGHIFTDKTRPINTQGNFEKPVIINDDVWIGSDAKILAGVTIGTHSVIGANSVVTHDIPQYSLSVGAPARVIKTF